MAGARGHERDAGRFGDPAPSVRHVRGRGLVARVQDRDVAAVRGVVQREDLVTRQREDRPDAVGAQRLDDQLGAGHAAPTASAPATAHSWSCSPVPPPHPIAPITRPAFMSGTAPMLGSASPRSTAGTAAQKAEPFIAMSPSSLVARRNATAATAFARAVSVLEKPAPSPRAMRTGR